MAYKSAVSERIRVAVARIVAVAGLTVFGGVFWGMDGLWCGMLAALVLALPLAFLPKRANAEGEQ